MTATTVHRAAPEDLPADPAAWQRARRRGRRTLVLLALVCVAPVLASYLAFYLWQPQGRVNHGTLLEPARIPRDVLPGAAGQSALTQGELVGRWTLVFAGDAACDPRCDAALYAMRQARLAQAKEMDRVGRLWLVTDAAEPPAALLARHDGLRVARAAGPWLERLPGAGAGTHVYLIDPLGNVMMRFPEPPDPKGVLRDLQRLLKYSPLGRG